MSRNADFPIPVERKYEYPPLGCSAFRLVGWTSVQMFDWTEKPIDGGTSSMIIIWVNKVFVFIFLGDQAQRFVILSSCIHNTPWKTGWQR